jgi:hypothetical protein
VTDSPGNADWMFLPVRWNKYWWNNEEDRRGHRLNAEIQACIIDRERTFLVCEYDPLGLQPDMDLTGMTIFTSNRMADYEQPVFDIPLLVHPHRLPPKNVTYLASFVGNMETHGIRTEMAAELDVCPECYLPRQFLDIDRYMGVMRQSLVGLAPRGDGAQSYRFYEAMQAGVVPLYLSDIDGRPFKDWIDWDNCSLYRQDCVGLCDYLHLLDREELSRMGSQAADIYNGDLQYGQWCRYVVKTLEDK